MAENKTKKICILGAGSFGKAAYSLLESKGHDVVLWSRNKNIAEFASDKDYLVFAVPAQNFREVFAKAVPFIGSAVCINLAKGIERGTLNRMSEVAEEICPGCKYVALSGPSHAEEIVLGLPTSVSVSSNDKDLLKDAQDLFHKENFRVYINEDLIGIELGGALKNVIALVSGMSDGLQLGDNAKAAMMTRGLAEIARLGVAMGADPLTFAGLSGLGDLIVTCTSMHSRNRRCGILMGQGMDPKAAAAEIGQIVEGIPTCYAAYELAVKYGIDMPITTLAYRFLEHDIDINEALSLLLARSRKKE